MVIPGRPVSLKNRRVWTGKYFIKNPEAAAYIDEVVTLVRDIMPDDDWRLDGTFGLSVAYCHQDWRSPDGDVPATTLLDALARKPGKDSGWHLTADDRYAIGIFSCKILGENINSPQDEFCVLYLTELLPAYLTRFATESTKLVVDVAERILAGELEVTYKQIWN